MNENPNIKNLLLSRQNNLVIAMIILNNLDKIDQNYLKRLIVKAIENMDDQDKNILGELLNRINKENTNAKNTTPITKSNN